MTLRACTRLGPSEVDAQFSVAALLFFAVTFLAAPVFAQTPYIAAAVGVDVTRFGRVEGFGIADAQPDGEALAVSLRVGTSVGQRWGVEFGFTRPDKVATEVTQGFPIPLRGSSFPGITNAVLGPDFRPRVEIARRNTTLDASGWIAQSVGQRMELVYLAGVSFARVIEEVDYGFGSRGAVRFAPSSTRAVAYGVSPLVGMEARIALTDHVFLVPGLRLSGINAPTGDGWLFRATTGLGWRF